MHTHTMQAFTQIITTNAKFHTPVSHMQQRIKGKSGTVHARHRSFKWHSVLHFTQACQGARHFAHMQQSISPHEHIMHRLPPDQGPTQGQQCRCRQGKSHARAHTFFSHIQVEAQGHKRTQVTATQTVPQQGSKLAQGWAHSTQGTKNIKGQQCHLQQSTQHNKGPHTHRTHMACRLTGNAQGAQSNAQSGTQAGHATQQHTTAIQCRQQAQTFRAPHAGRHTGTNRHTKVTGCRVINTQQCVHSAPHLQVTPTTHSAQQFTCIQTQTGTVSSSMLHTVFARRHAPAQSQHKLGNSTGPVTGSPHQVSTCMSGQSQKHATNMCTGNTGTQVQQHHRQRNVAHCHFTTKLTPTKQQSMHKANHTIPSTIFPNSHMHSQVRQSANAAVAQNSFNTIAPQCTFRQAQHTGKTNRVHVIPHRHIPFNHRHSITTHPPHHHIVIKFRITSQAHVQFHHVPSFRTGTNSFTIHNSGTGQYEQCFQTVNKAFRHQATHSNIRTCTQHHMHNIHQFTCITCISSHNAFTAQCTQCTPVHWPGQSPSHTICNPRSQIIGRQATHNGHSHTTQFSMHT